MTREYTAKLLTVLLLAGLATFVWIRRSAVSASGQNAANGPVETVYAMLDAARRGDVEAYLSHYSAPLEVSLRRTASEKGYAGFKDYLVRSNAEIKGIALTGPKAISDREVQIRVEYVFKDRNEAQTMYLENRSGPWRIYRVDDAERLKTLIPYGAPAEQ
jgi:hypothetical protein